MKKEKITLDQLTAGGLLKFGKLDSVDMTLLMGGICRTSEFVNEENDSLNNYFILANGMVLLNEDYVRKFWNKSNEEVLERIQGSTVKKYIESLNIFEFTLRKIKLFGLGCVVKDALEETFSDNQLKALEKLYQRGFIEDYNQEDVRYGDYEAVRLTQKGKLALFLIDNRKDIDSFFEILRYVGYSEDFLNEFLLNQDLDKECYEILTIDNFEKFCLAYDKIPTSLGYIRKKSK